MDLPLPDEDRFACLSDACSCHQSPASRQSTPPPSAKANVTHCTTFSSEASTSERSIFDDDGLYASSVSSVPDAPTPEGPPDNFGVVEASTIYRSAFPSHEHYRFLAHLGLKTILCLVGSTPDADYVQWMKQTGVQFIQVGMPGKRETAASGVPGDVCARALDIVLDESKYPLLIHCNHGKHRTGTVVACLRITQQWHRSRALDEYARHAHPKERDADISFIQTFVAAPV